MIEIKTEPGHLRIQLEDDRLGLDPAATESGLIRCARLGRLHRRVTLMGGALRVSIAPSGGARVRITVPLRKPEAR